MKHAPLAPSSAHIWNKCTGWLFMKNSLKDDELPEETDAMREGTAAHYVLECQLKDITPDSTAPNGAAVTQEMVEMSADLVIDVWEKRNAHPDSVIMIEETLNSIDPIHKDCWGTPDVVLIDQKTKQVWIWDYKFGHMHVSEYENEQMLCYAVGITQDAGILDIDNWSFHLSIYQPRCYVGYPLRTWSIKGNTLLARSQMLNKSADDNYLNPVCKTGSHCRYCPSSIICSANLKATNSLIDLGEKPQPLRPTNEQLSVELTALDRAISLLENRKRSMSILAEEKIKSGEDVPQYEMSQKSAPRIKWIKNLQEQAAYSLAMMGEDVKYGVNIPTPKQIEKKGIDLALFKSYIQEEPASMALKRCDEQSVVRLFGKRGE